ncbi:MAG: polysaccharide deacetylase family protein [Psychroserpens sp.]|uniref:polysaccharide deacetylase family protein n=1 Tax=Psychroserpens sp. TaxID=2020870 RepID=UPI003C76B08F
MNILTFDIEEWFHLLDNASTKSENQWQNFEVRIHQNMERVFEILEATDAKASFFVLGWIAEKYPEVVREISNKGYEIGSHTTFHQLVYEQSRETFQTDVERSIKTLEDISGKKVRMFRAPGFSITESNKWAFEVLHDLGIEIDSSVFPAGRAHGGLPSYGVAEPSILNYNGVQLKEFPINTYKILNKPMIFSGGGYFRFFPYKLVKKWTQNSDYIMSYFHPRDFDPDQPILDGLPAHRKFKSYVGLKKADQKLKRWINDFDFIDIKTANSQIDWETVKTIQL